MFFREKKERINGISLQKKSKLFIICAGAFVFLVLVIFSYFIFFKNKLNLYEGSKIGLIADIHAASDEERMVDGVVMGYPRVYKQHFSAALDEMKKQGINLVIALGDNTNAGNNKKAQSLVDIAKSEGMKVIWVKGNHDMKGTDVMKKFGVQSPYYYYTDKGDWRIIVLDSSEIDPAGTGGIDEQQLEWLKNTLKTDKKVIIAMHHPVYNESDTNIVQDIYKGFKETIEKAGNVKYVLSGHYHTKSISNVSNGITYKTIKSLTLDENIPNFEILSLQ